MRWVILSLQWLVLWPLWRRMAWPRRWQIGAAVGTGFVWLAVIIAVSAATGTEEETARVAASPTPTASLTAAVVAATGTPTSTSMPRATATPTMTPTVSPTATSTPAATPTLTPRATPSPTPPPSVTVQILSITSPVPAGGIASLVAQAAPGMSCSISYVTPAGTTSQAEGLDSKTAGADGRVSWEWRIGPSTRAGTGTVTVRCGSATDRASIVIQ